MTKNEFYQKWLENFAVDISQDKIEQYVISTGNYLWHIFSWELLEKDCYLVGDAAKKAYEKVNKENAAYLVWFKDENTKTVTPCLSSAEALDQWEEVYVVGENFAWTYIKTHECMCGPYFLERKDI